MPAKKGKIKFIKVSPKKSGAIKSQLPKKTKTGKNSKNIITKDILMGELVSKYPQTSEVLLKNGLHCIGCMLSPYESLEAGIAVHGIPLQSLLKELNQVINKVK